jgi:hypothetical protein
MDCLESWKQVTELSLNYASQKKKKKLSLHPEYIVQEVI